MNFFFAVRFSRLSTLVPFIACLCSLALSAGALPSRAQTPNRLKISWDKGKQGAFIMAMTRDARGRLLVGTEDKGLWRCDSSGRIWSPIALRNGVYGDRVCALACDRLGRVWIGTQNGVAVLVTGEFSRDKITTYKTLDGLSGERVFAIATSPNGDVWIGTNAGITRYSLQNDSWRTYSRADGLPAIDVCALAFAPDGTLYAGTQTDGLAIASPKNDYATWQSVPFERALPLVGTAQEQKMLPCGQVNAIRVLDNGTIAVATPTGLALSTDKGQSWAWRRGANWADKVRGLLGGAPKGWKETDSENGVAAAPVAILPDDYITSLAQNGDGELVVGTRQKGVALLNAQFEAKTVPNAADFVRTLLSFPDGSLLVGGYGSGVQQLEFWDKPNPSRQKRLLRVQRPPTSRTLPSKQFRHFLKRRQRRTWPN